MEFSEAGEWKHKPELEHIRPEEIFKYALESQHWIRDRVHERERLTAFEYLAEQLDTYTQEHFDPSTEFTVSSNDVYHTGALNHMGPGTYLLRADSVPLEGIEELTHEATFTGYLHGFHVGDRDDIRFYIDTGVKPYKTMGGIFQPLLSVGVEKATITFKNESEQAQLRERGEYIRDQLHSHEYSQEVQRSIATLLSLLDITDIAASTKLRESEAYILVLSTQVEQSLIDAIFDIMSIKLGFTVPQDISVTSYRSIVSKNSFIPQNRPREFTRVMAKLGFAGETIRPILAVNFFKDDEWIRANVQHVTSITKSQLSRE